MNPHGTRQRHRQGCRCEPCRKAWNVYNYARRKARKGGQWQGLVNSKPVRTHVKNLGVPVVVIAKAAGVSRTVIDRVLKGQSKIWASSREAILAVAHKDVLAAYPLLDKNAFVPSGETQQFLAELRKSGFGPCLLGRKIGVRTLKAERPKVRLWNAKRVEKLYRTLGTKAA